MNYSIHANVATPAYIQLYQQLRDDITNGFYPYAAKIPSKRTLAAETGVSVITIKHTLELLCDEGYIEARQRCGYFVIYKKEDFLGIPIPVTQHPIQQSASKGAGEFPYTVLARTMRKVILNYQDKLLTKSPNQGCMELRTEICAYLARSRSIHISPTQVLIGSGAEYLYSLIAQLFDRGTVFAIEDPSYDKIKKVYEAFNIPVNLLTLRQDGIDSAELKSSNATILHTTPFNSFPSGITIGVSKKLEYLQWAKSRNGFIIEDNYDSELTISKKQEDSLFELSNGKNVIYINTFSKTIAPSIRIGYMILPENMVDIFKQKLGFYSCTVPVFDQYVLAELLHEGDFERHINRIRRKRRKALSTQ